MYVSVSRLRVPEERAGSLVSASRDRSGLVDDWEGFVDLQVWQSDRDPGELLMHHQLPCAIGDVAGYVDLERQVAWLAGILEALDFPLDHLAGNFLAAADVVATALEDGAPAAERLRAGAALVRTTPSFV